MRTNQKQIPRYRIYQIIAVFVILTIIALGRLNAQIQFEDREYFSAAIVTDPFATLDSGFNLGAEVELHSLWGYIRGFTQVHPVMEVPYLDLGAAMGVTLKVGHFSPLRYYFGGRLGVISRDWKFGYPTVGAEAGVNLLMRNNYVIGVRGTYDYRTDFKYWNNPSEWRPSAYLRLGIIF